MFINNIFQVGCLNIPKVWNFNCIQLHCHSLLLFSLFNRFSQYLKLDMLYSAIEFWISLFSHRLNMFKLFQSPYSAWNMLLHVINIRLNICIIKSDLWYSKTKVSSCVNVGWLLEMSIELITIDSHYMKHDWIWLMCKLQFVHAQHLNSWFSMLIEQQNTDIWFRP